MSPRFLLDEHVTRVFERVLREHGTEVVHAVDEIGEQTVDKSLLEWCTDHQYILITNDLKDFKPLHTKHDHHGIFVYTDPRLPDRDPEGLARAVIPVVEQYETADMKNTFVDLNQWYEWIQE